MSSGLVNNTALNHSKMLSCRTCRIQSDLEVKNLNFHQSEVVYAALIRVLGTFGQLLGEMYTRLMLSTNGVRESCWESNGRPTTLRGIMLSDE